MGHTLSVGYCKVRLRVKAGLDNHVIYCRYYHFQGKYGGLGYREFQFQVKGNFNSKL